MISEGLVGVCGWHDFPFEKLSDNAFASGAKAPIFKDAGGTAEAVPFPVVPGLK